MQMYILMGCNSLSSVTRGIIPVLSKQAETPVVQTAVGKFCRRGTLNLISQSLEKQ